MRHFSLSLKKMENNQKSRNRSQRLGNSKTDMKRKTLSSSPPGIQRFHKNRRRTVLLEDRIRIQYLCLSVFHWKMEVNPFSVFFSMEVSSVVWFKRKAHSIYVSMMMKGAKSAPCDETHRFDDESHGKWEKHECHHSKKTWKGETDFTWLRREIHRRKEKCTQTRREKIENFDDKKTDNLRETEGNHSSSKYSIWKWTSWCIYGFSLYERRWRQSDAQDLVNQEEDKRRNWLKTVAGDNDVVWGTKVYHVNRRINCDQLKHQRLKASKTDS